MGRVCDGAGKGGQWGGYVMVRGRVGNGEGWEMRRNGQGVGVSWECERGGVEGLAMWRIGVRRVVQ